MKFLTDSRHEGEACRHRRRAAVGLAAEFGRLIAEETEKWAKVVRAVGLKAE